MKKRNLLLILVLSLVAFNISFASKPIAKHVIWIGLDGWGSYSVEKADMPVTKELMRNGSYTLKKRAVLPSSSAVNWGSMFMGACPELHGYTQSGSKTPEIPSRELNQHGIFPTIFQLYRDADPNAEIGCLYEWEGIKYIVDTLALSYLGQVQGDYKKNTDILPEMAVKYIAEKKPNLVAVIFNNADYIGHSYGHDTPAYYDNLKKLDDYIGQIVETVKRAGMIDETVFIITSDHGGIKSSHGGKTLLELETPFIISGKNIKKDYCFDDISMMQFDCASTVATVLGLTQPQVWIGRSMPVFK